MEIFLNSTNLEDIKTMWDTGLISGVTTNPKLISESDTPFEKLVQSICDIVDCPVSVQAISEDVENMLNEAVYIASISKKIVVKIPATFNGFTVASKLNSLSIPSNITLCYALGQVMTSMVVKAKYISIFLGNLLDQTGEQEAEKLLYNSIKLKKESDTSSKILAASIRNANHFIKAIEYGADCVTTQSSVIKEIAGNKLSETGLQDFLEKWQNSKQHQYFNETCRKA